MEQGRLELRSGPWEWRVQEPEAPGEQRRLRLRPTTEPAERDPDDEMVVLVDRGAPLTEDRIRRLAERATTRRFRDAEGVRWTVELKAPRLATPDERQPSPMILFWSEDRACMATLRPARGLGELTMQELRAQLRACLDG